MKKLSIFFIILIILLNFMGVFAQNEVRTTDICAYINNFPISTYNLNNQNAVYASNLRNYGFDVLWNEAERRVDITLSKNDIEGSFGILRDHISSAGSVISSATNTDIVTYINGEKVESFNIDGKTVIYLKELKRFGEIVWDASQRAAKVEITGKRMIEFGPVPYKYSLTKYVPMLENVAPSDAFLLKEHLDLATVTYKYDANKLTSTHIANYILLLKECGFDIANEEDAILFLHPNENVLIYLNNDVLCVKINAHS